MSISDQPAIVSGTLYNNELKHSASGVAYCSFSVGKVKSKKNKDTNQWDYEKTVFYNCICFGKEAEHIGKYPAKETKVQVALEFDQDEYTDKSGNKKKSDKFIVRKLLECKPKTYNQGYNQAPPKQQNQPPQQYNQAPPQNHQSNDFDDDIPF